jgi:hypothetical protein
MDHMAIACAGGSAPQEASMAHPIEYHVSPVGELWKVGIPGDSQPLSYHHSKSEAVAHAVQLARTHPRSRVVLHKADGSIEEEYPRGGVERSS